MYEYQAVSGAREAQAALVEQLRAIRVEREKRLTYASASYVAPYHDRGAQARARRAAAGHASSPAARTWGCGSRRNCRTCRRSSTSATSRSSGRCMPRATHLEIGAAVSLTDAFAALVRGVSRAHGDRAPLCVAADLQRRHARRQHRQRLAHRRLHAGAHLPGRERGPAGRRSGTRTLPLEDLYLDYMKKDLRARRVRRCGARAARAPWAALAQLQDRQALRPGHLRGVRGLLRSSSTTDACAHARVAFGGMAATPQARSRCEQALMRRRVERSRRRARGAGAREGLQAAHRHAGLRGLPRAGGGQPAAPLSCRSVRSRTASERVEPCRADGRVRGVAVGAEWARRPHESAHLHVSGEAVYCDDIPLPEGALHAAIGVSDEGACAPARSRP